jgi:hypothetical protein
MDIDAVKSVVILKLLCKLLDQLLLTRILAKIIRYSELLVFVHAILKQLEESDLGSNQPLVIDVIVFQL